LEALESGIDVGDARRLIDDRRVCADAKVDQRRMESYVVGKSVNQQLGLTSS
jgi:hypothetical protein